MAICEVPWMSAVQRYLHNYVVKGFDHLGVVELCHLSLFAIFN